MMNLRRARLFVLFLGCLLFSLFGLTSAGRIRAQDADADGIPANCENPQGAYYNANLFPRYAAGENRLVLIDWSSGAVALELETSITDPVFWLIGWSPDCHYLTGGLGDGERFTTIIWDAVNGGRLGSVEDAYRQPHKITWSPLSDSVVVETRRGAFLWMLATGQRLQLTVDGSWAGDSYISAEWNYADGTLETVNRGNLPIIYSLTTGRIVNYSLPEGEYIGSTMSMDGSPRVRSLITAPTAQSPYGCEDYGYFSRHSDFEANMPPNVYLWFGANRLVFVDEATGETVGTLASGLESFPTNKRPGSFAPGCEYVFTVHRTDVDGTLSRIGFMWRIADGELIVMIEDVPTFHYISFREYLPRSEWDETGRYFFIQTYNGAQVWDSETNRIIWLTTAEESVHDGHSITGVVWDSVNHTITVDIRFSEEFRTFDLLTGTRLS